MVSLALARSSEKDKYATKAERKQGKFIPVFILLLKKLK